MKKIVVKISRDTRRGASTTPVYAGTIVEVLAQRRDEDGLKLLVRAYDLRGAFQVNADETNITAAELALVYGATR